MATFPPVSAALAVPSPTVIVDLMTAPVKLLPSPKESVCARWVD